MKPPSRAWYVLGGALAAAGAGMAVLLVVTGFLGFTDRIDEFQRVPLGAEGTVVFERAGGYSLYYETRSADVEDVPGFGVALLPEGGGEPIAMSEYDSRVTYEVGGRHGRARYSFRIDEPGRYLLKVGKPAGRDGATAGEVVAVGRGIGRGVVARIFAAVLIGVFGVGGGAAVIIVTALRRHAARTRPQP